MTHRVSRTSAILIALSLTFAVIGLQGCATEGDGSADQMHQSATAGDTKTATDATATPAAADPEEESMYQPTIELTGKEIAVITTAKGVIKLRFFPEDAPNHVRSFVELAQKGFYNGTTFHRIEPGFVAQGGDPYSKTGEGPVGTGGPGYRIAAEFNERPHLEGTLAMARSQDPNSAGSQFYICLAPARFLDGNYTVFGEVVEGMDVVKALAVGDVMESVTIENAAE